MNRNTAAAIAIFACLFASPSANSQTSQTATIRILVHDVKWRPSPGLPKGAQTAVLYGDPSKPGLFTLRVKLPPNFKMPIHSHPDERIRTIISGTYYSAVGQAFDHSSLVAFPAGTFSHVPPKVWQFAETRDQEVVFEVTGIGPTGIAYLDPSDDPKKK